MTNHFVKEKVFFFSLIFRQSTSTVHWSTLLYGQSFNCRSFLSAFLSFLLLQFCSLFLLLFFHSHLFFDWVTLCLRPLPVYIYETTYECISHHTQKRSISIIQLNGERALNITISFELSDWLA